MAKKNNEIKENEELKEEVVQETTTETPEKVEEIKENEEKELVDSEEEKQDAKVQENASNTEQDAAKQVKEKADKQLTVKEVFKDKYDEKVVYNPGDIFIKSDKIQDKKPIKAENGKYKVSKERYEELKRSLYVD